MHHRYKFNLIKNFVLITNITLYIPKIDDYLNILIHEEVEHFVSINFSEYLKSVREEQNLRKVTKLLYVFLTTPDEVEKYAQSNSCNNSVHQLCNFKSFLSRITTD